WLVWHLFHLSLTFLNTKAQVGRIRFYSRGVLHQPRQCSIPSWSQAEQGAKCTSAWKGHSCIRVPLHLTTPGPCCPLKVSYSSIRQKPEAPLSCDRRERCL